MSNSDDSYGPALPPGMHQGNISDDSSSDEDPYGPALLKPSCESKAVSDTCSTVLPTLQSGSGVIGPVLPPNYLHLSKISSDSDSVSSSDGGLHHSSKKKKKYKKSHLSNRGNGTERQGEAESAFPSKVKCSDSFTHNFEYAKSDNEIDESDDAIIGPSIGLQASEQDLSALKEFESRSIKMKERLTSISKPDEVEAPKQRESWMTELPEEMGASFGLSKRQFRTREAPEQDSSWTEAPHEQGKKRKDEKKRKKGKNDYFQSDKDRKAAKEIEAYNKKHRPDSLLEMHKKEMKKKKKKEKKKKKKDKLNEKERRPFDRDVDLKVNRFDNAQKQAYIKRSQELGSRFQAGATGTSFL